MKYMIGRLRFKLRKLGDYVIEKTIVKLFEIGYKNSGLAAEMHYFKNVIECQLESKISSIVISNINSVRNEIIDETKKNDLAEMKLRIEASNIMEEVISKIIKTK